VGNIETLITNMAVRPPMYVHPVNVYSIENLLRGFLYHWIDEIKTYEFDPTSVNCVFRSFIDRWICHWIRKNIDDKYDTEDSFFSDMLTSVAKNEDEAVKIFFSACQEFFMLFHKNQPEYWAKIAKEGWG